MKLSQHLKYEGLIIWLLKILEKFKQLKNQTFVIFKN